MAKVEAKTEMPQTVPPPTSSRVDEKIMRPGKYEITDDNVFTVEVHLIQKEGRWLIATGSGKGVDSHKVIFRMWNYNEMINLRKMATTYDHQKRIHLTDNDSLNRLKIQNFMLSWTFDRDNPKLKIFHVGGTLVDESWQTFVKLQPNIISHIIDEMNKVYEFNG